MHYVILGTFLPSREFRICDNMYFGFFEDGPSQEGIANGELKDNEGHSNIGGVVLEGDRFEFTQVPDREGTKVRYSFHKEGNIWVGMYSGGKRGSGHTKCVINPVDLRFLAS